MGLFEMTNSEPGRFFRNHGYWLCKGVYDQSEIVKLERDFDRIVLQLLTSGESVDAKWSGPEMDRIAERAQSVIHTHNVQQYSATWMSAIQSSRLLDAAELLLGPDIVLHHTKLFQKPAETGAPFPMHQDWSYFPTENDTMLAAIIHVSQATDEMGCLRVYPGSHKLGRLVDSSGQHQSEFVSRFPIEGSTSVPAEAGDVLFFDYRTVHGSMPNRSDNVRKTVLVQMHSGTDQVEEGNSHPNERLVLRGWNYRTTRSLANQGS